MPCSRRKCCLMTKLSQSFAGSGRYAEYCQVPPDLSFCQSRRMVCRCLCAGRADVMSSMQDRLISITYCFEAVPWPQSAICLQSHLREQITDINLWD